MVGEDATKLRVIDKIDGGLVPRLAAIKGPEELIRIGHENGVVGKRVYTFHPIGGDARCLLMPGVAVVIGITQFIIACLEEENPVLFVDDEMSRIDVNHAVNGVPCRTFIM